MLRTTMTITAITLALAAPASAQLLGGSLVGNTVGGVHGLTGFGEIGGDLASVATYDTFDTPTHAATGAIPGGANGAASVASQVTNTAGGLGSIASGAASGARNAGPPLRTGTAPGKARAIDAHASDRGAGSNNGATNVTAPLRDVGVTADAATKSSTPHLASNGANVNASGNVKAGR